MNWEEFKKRVDQKLKEEGISEDQEIAYIDTYPDDDLHVYADENGDICIS